MRYETIEPERKKFQWSRIILKFIRNLKANMLPFTKCLYYDSVYYY